MLTHFNNKCAGLSQNSTPAEHCGSPSLLSEGQRSLTFVSVTPSPHLNRLQTQQQNNQDFTAHAQTTSYWYFSAAEAWEELGMRHLCPETEGKKGFTHVYIVRRRFRGAYDNLVSDTINGACRVSAAPPHIQEYWLCVMNTLLETHSAQCSRQPWTPGSTKHILPNKETFYISSIRSLAFVWCATLLPSKSTFSLKHSSLRKHMICHVEQKERALYKELFYCISGTRAMKNTKIPFFSAEKIRAQCNSVRRSMSSWFLRLAVKCRLK